MPKTIAAHSTQTRHEADLQLVQRVLSKDDEAIRVFVERMQCIPAIISAQNKRMGRPLTPEDQCDVVQESLIKIWRKLNDYAGRASLETWVYRFCFLEMMNGIRKKRRWFTSAQSDGEMENLVAPSKPSVFEFEYLHRGLEYIGPPESDVLRLKHFEELTFAEIAKRLSISANTAKTQYYRGLSKLKDRIDQGFGKQPEGSAL